MEQRLSSEDVQDTDRIIEITREERQRVENDSDYCDDPMVLESLEATSWLFTYYTKSDERPRLRLALCHPSVDYKLALVKENDSVVLMPAGTTEEQAGRVTDVCRQNVASLTEISDFKQNVGHHVGVAKAAIQTLAELFESVSPSFHVGVQTLDGQHGISTFMGDQDPFSLTLVARSLDNGT